MRQSLSYSKREMLVTCLRRYFYEYYAPAKKVPFDASRKAAIASLKEMSGLHMLYGDVGHWFIEQYLKKGDSSRSWVERTAFERFDKAVLYSRDPRYRGRAHLEQYPPPAIMEFQFGDPDADALSASLRESLATAIDNFYRPGPVRDAWAQIVAGEHWVEKRLTGLPKIDGFGVEGRADLVGRDAGGVRIIDWKFGQPGGTQDSLQLHIYGLWAEKEFGIRPEQVRVQRIYLRGGTVEPERALDRASLRVGRARLIQDIELMREMDPYGQAGNEEAFTPCNQINVCKQCKYRTACPEGAAFFAPRPTSASLLLIQAPA
jgi:PD-(D/E)XK nuclease superfamily